MDPVSHIFTPRAQLRELSLIAPDPGWWANLWHSVILRRYLTLTVVQGQGLVLVSWQNEDHQIKKVVWEKP